MSVRSRSWRGLACVLLLAAQGCREAPSDAVAGTNDEPARSRGPFVEKAAAFGLDFVHRNGMRGERLMPEVTGSGVALVDYDGDGDLDVYLVQSGGLPDDPDPAGRADRLYRNELAPGESAALRFVDVTRASRLRAEGYGMGVATGDFDGDGFPDLFVTNVGADQLLRNAGDGTFDDVTVRAGVGDPRWNVPALFADFDGDGLLDLFVGSYVRFPFDDPPVCRDLTGARDYCGPSNFEPEPDRLYRNRGGGAFEDATEVLDLRSGFGPALAAVAADLNRDGRLDLYVANDLAPNNLWIQTADGTFEDRALLSGAAVDRAGKPQASMGIGAEDFDADGDLDLFLTHLVTENNTVYANDGSGMFEDVSEASGVAGPSRPFTAFGTVSPDWDQDGDPDLLVVNGAVRTIPALARRGDPFPLHERDQIFRNQGGGRFVEVGPGGGGPFERSEVGRGAAAGDLDEDGDEDVVLSNNHGPARLLLRIGEPTRWAGARVLERGGDRDALGAEATLTDGTRRWLRRVHVDGSYASSQDPRVHWHPGGAAPVLDLEIRWNDGSRSRWRAIPSERMLIVSRSAG